MSSWASTYSWGVPFMNVVALHTCQVLSSGPVALHDCRLKLALCIEHVKGLGRMVDLMWMQVDLS